MVEAQRCELLPPQYEYIRYEGDSAALEAARLWVEENTDGVIDTDMANVSQMQTGLSYDADTGKFYIFSVYGSVECNEGDYIVKEPPGMFGDKQLRPYSPALFTQTFRTA